MIKQIFFEMSLFKYFCFKLNILSIEEDLYVKIWY